MCGLCSAPRMEAKTNYITCNNTATVKYSNGSRLGEALTAGGNAALDLEFTSHFDTSATIIKWIGHFSKVNGSGRPVQIYSFSRD